MRFDADGTLPSFPPSLVLPYNMLIIAMEGEKQQQKRATITGTTTPKKSKAWKPEIGSSSTWNHDQLELFKVHAAGKVDPKCIIPEKWFNFTNVD